MPDSLHLIHITDLHLSLPEKVMPEIGMSTEASLKKVLDCIRLEEHDAIICTGDMADTPNLDTYQHLYSLLAPLATPVFCLAGNHDHPAIGSIAASKTIAQWLPHTLMQDWLIVFLNSHLPGAEHGFLGEEELLRLDQTLRQFPDRHTLICLHHHPVEMGSRWMDLLMLQDDAAFFNVVDRYSQIRGILWGHVHQEYSSERNGVRLLSTPSTCRQFKPLSNSFETDTRPPAYRRLVLTKSGTITTETIYCSSTS
ncbi:MAG: phosphodiesterase [bacterium]